MTTTPIFIPYISGESNDYLRNHTGSRVSGILASCPTCDTGSVTLTFVRGPHGWMHERRDWCNGCWSDWEQADQLSTEELGKIGFVKEDVNTKWLEIKEAFDDYQRRPEQTAMLARRAAAEARKANQDAQDAARRAEVWSARASRLAERAIALLNALDDATYDAAAAAP